MKKFIKPEISVVFFNQNIVASYGPDSDGDIVCWADVESGCPVKEPDDIPFEVTFPDWCF